MNKIQKGILLVVIGVIVFVSFAVSFQAYAEEKRSVQDILVIAKFTGACGILDSLILFQNTTKMPGGDEFVARFWSVEAARLGISIEKMLQQCQSAVTLYDSLWKSAEQKPPVNRK